MSLAKRQRRADFRAAVFGRDGYRCVFCGHPSPDESEIDAHHIVNRNHMPDGGYTLDNGVTLCKVGNNCHLRAEREEPGYSVEDIRAGLALNTPDVILWYFEGSSQCLKALSIPEGLYVRG